MPKRAFDTEATLLLNAIVENGDADGMLAADVKKKWSKFENINGNTFRAKLKSVRDKFREKAKNNQSKSMYLFLPYKLF